MTAPTTIAGSTPVYRAPVPQQGYSHVSSINSGAAGQLAAPVFSEGRA